MRGLLIRNLATVVAVLGYLYAATWALSESADILVPTWSLGILPKTPSSLLPIALVEDALLLAAVSLPFAWALARLSRHIGFAVPASASIWAALLATLVWGSTMPHNSTPFPRVHGIARLVMLISALPALTFLLYRLPSNYRMERS